MGQHMDVVNKVLVYNQQEKKENKDFEMATDNWEIICNLGVCAVAKVIED